MSGSMENVFIAWEGNQSLANLVDAKLNRYGFAGVVGGGTKTDTFIGSQIFSQIQQCTRAIVLVEKKHLSSEVNFSSNLMFEWGYLTARMDPSKIHVFLIDVCREQLPSDLSGIWAIEIKKHNKSFNEIAQEIANEFHIVTSRPLNNIDKAKILSCWDETKRNLSVYPSTPVYSEVELAHYLLHSVEVCYYHMEDTEFIYLIDRIVPASSILEFTVQIIKLNSILFSQSVGLTKQLPFDTITELKALFEKKFDFSIQDNNLNLWLKYFCISRLALLYLFIAQSDDMHGEYKDTYCQKALEYSKSAINVLNEIIEKFPQESVYVKLYEGYIYRDLYKIYSFLGDTESAFQNITTASQARKSFYLYYKHHYPNDEYLIKHFGEEYYLSCAECLKFITDPTEKKIAEKAIHSFLAKLKNEMGRQHVVLKQLLEII